MSRLNTVNPTAEYQHAIYREVLQEAEECPSLGEGVFDLTIQVRSWLSLIRDTSTRYRIFVTKKVGQGYHFAATLRSPCAVAIIQLFVEADSSNSSYRPPQLVNDRRNRQKLTPLHLACREGMSEVVRKLLEHGARPYLKDNRGHTSLHFAAGRLSDHLLKELLKWRESGLAMALKDETGRTPLHVAISWSSKTHVKILIDCGAPVDTIALRLAHSLIPMQSDIRQLVAEEKPFDEAIFFRRALI